MPETDVVEDEEVEVQGKEITEVTDDQGSQKYIPQGH